MDSGGELVSLGGVISPSLNHLHKLIPLLACWFKSSYDTVIEGVAMLNWTWESPFVQKPGPVPESDPVCFIGKLFMGIHGDIRRISMF